MGRAKDCEPFNSKPWIKLWTEPWLMSSARQSLAPDERGVHIDLLCLAKRKNGAIEILNRPNLARMLQVSTKLLNKTLQKLEKLNIIRPQSGPEVGAECELFLVTKWQDYQGGHSNKPPITNEEK
jgi:hypothetical protein